MVDKEFLYTKDLLFFNKPRTYAVTDENDKYFCFRTFVTDDYTEKVDKRLTPYEDNESLMVNCAELDDDIEIKITRSGNFLINFHVAQYFIPHIIGAKGARRKQIEAETKAHIKMPKPGCDEKVIITGPTERSVYSAKMRINLVLLEMREKHPLTHFVSIPVVSNEVKGNFELFKERILNGPPLRGVDETIFQKPEKLHLTIVPLVLLDETDIEEAIKALHECKDEYWQPLFSNVEPLKIVMRGVEIMNDDPKDVDVLYAKVHLNINKYNSSFQKFVNGIADKFAKKGFVRKQYDNVKLHATLMNSLFRHSKSENAKRESFDATHILDKYKDFEFGETNLKDVHLSIRLTTDNNKYYKSETVVTL